MSSAKACALCGEVFERSQLIKSQWCCRPCHSKYMKDYRQANLERVREIGRRSSRKSQLKNSYGLTLERFSELFLSQDSRCAICGEDEPGGKGWCVDHSHSTGEVRGILCPQCNFLLGNAKDRIDVLLAAVDYLKENNKEK